jgi:putative ABC transport system substrate-binding protein
MCYYHNNTFFNTQERKKKMKKLGVVLLSLFLCFGIVGCKKEDGKLQIGILQYLSHEALDLAKDGFIEGLEEAGFIDGENITITVLNPQTEASVMQTMVEQLVRESDLILAIATTAAVAVMNEANGQGKDVPILFTAVTDPVDAELVETMEAPGGNVTGTSDMNPVADQIELVKELLPNATKVGILYTSSEENSEIQANIAIEAAEDLDMTTAVRTISTLNDLTTVVNALISTDLVDAIYVPTDNLIASSMGTLEEIVKSNPTKYVPIVCGETSQVLNGGSITYGLNYFNLGKDTAAMAVRILNGELPRNIPATTVQTVELIINKKQLEEDLGITVPTSLLERADQILE